MAEEQIPIKIIIPAEEEPPLTPERPPLNVTEQALTVGRKIGAGARIGTKRVWQSETRKKVTGGVRRGTSAAVRTGSRTVRRALVRVSERQARKKAAAVRTRIQSTDWKQEAKTGTARSLRWLSRKMSRMADKVAASKKPPQDTSGSQPAE